MVTEENEALIYKPLLPVNFASELSQASGTIERNRGSFMQRRSLNRNFLLKANTQISCRANQSSRVFSNSVGVVAAANGTANKSE